MTCAESCATPLIIDDGVVSDGELTVLGAVGMLVKACIDGDGDTDGSVLPLNSMFGIGACSDVLCAVNVE